MNNIRPIEAASASLPQFDPANTIIRFPEVEIITGLARATVYKRLKDGRPLFALDHQQSGERLRPEI